MTFYEVLLQKAISGEDTKLYLNGIIQSKQKGELGEIKIVRFYETSQYALTMNYIFRTFIIEEVQQEFRNFVCDTAIPVVQQNYETLLRTYRNHIINFSLSDIAEILQTTMETSPIYQYFMDEFIKQSEKLIIARRKEEFYLYVWSNKFLETWRPFAQDDSTDQLMIAVKKMSMFELWEE